VQRYNDPQSLNRYSYVRNNPMILVDPDGHAWKPATSFFGGTPLGFMWIPESKSYDASGALKTGLYNQAIFFSDNRTFNPDSRFNMGSSTAYYYMQDGSIKQYNATTLPSDLKKFATVPEGFYEGHNGRHCGRSGQCIDALHIRDIGGDDKDRIQLSSPNPKYNDGRTHMASVHVHPAGGGNTTGYDSKGNPCSEGCSLIDIYQWADFKGNSYNAQQQNNVIGIGISRTLSFPIINYFDINGSSSDTAASTYSPD
jgi:hypothetical protein